MSRTMFAPSLAQQSSSLTIPSLILGSSALGQDPIVNYPAGLLPRSQSELTSRFLPDRLPVPHGLSPFMFRPEMHHHQHLHQHMHQHLMPPGSASSVDSTTPGAAAAFGATGASSLLVGMAGYSNLANGSSPLSSLPLPGLRHGSSQTLPLIGGPLGLSLSNGISGAFQPKNDVGSSINPMAHLMMPLQDRLSSSQGRGKKPGHWCAAHVRVAWEIHLHQQHQRQFQSEVQRLGSGSKNAAETDRLSDRLSDRLNDCLLNLPTGERGLPGHLESLYRLSAPLLGRSPFSTSGRNPLSSLPFGGLGGAMHRLTSPLDAPGGFGASSDWLRLSKSSSFSAPPPIWLRPEGEHEKAAEVEEEGRSRQHLLQETQENGRESESRRSSGSSKNERTRSRSPLRRHRKSSSRGSASPSHRTPSERCESGNSDGRRHERSTRTHNSSNTDSPGSVRNDPLPSLGPFSALYPRSEAANLTTDKVFMHHPPFLWPNSLIDSEQLMRRLLSASSEGDQALLKADNSLMEASRLAHLDLMFGKILPPGGLGLPYRHLPSSGYLGKPGLASSITLPLSRLPLAPIADSSSAIYKIMADGHHPELR